MSSTLTWTSLSSTYSHRVFADSRITFTHTPRNVGDACKILLSMYTVHASLFRIEGAIDRAKEICGIVTSEQTFELVQ